MTNFEIIEINEAVAHLALIVENEAYADKFQDNCKIAIQALKKQIPKKPRLNDSDYSYFECDSCGTAIAYSFEPEEHRFCLHCGQALDWERNKR